MRYLPGWTVQCINPKCGAHRTLAAISGVTTVVLLFFVVLVRKQRVCRLESHQWTQAVVFVSLYLSAGVNVF